MKCAQCLALELARRITGETIVQVNNRNLLRVLKECSCISVGQAQQIYKALGTLARYNIYIDAVYIDPSKEAA